MINYTEQDKARSGALYYNVFSAKEVIEEEQKAGKTTKENPAQTAGTVGGANGDLSDPHHNKTFNTTEKSLQGESKTKIEKAIEELNKKHAFVVLSGKSLILNEEKDDVTFSTIPDFKHRYSNRKLDGKSIATYWLESRTRLATIKNLLRIDRLDDAFFVAANAGRITDRLRSARHYARLAYATELLV